MSLSTALRATVAIVSTGVLLSASWLQAQEHQGKSLAEWRARTQAPHTREERVEAIRVVSGLGHLQGGHRTDVDPKTFPAVSRDINLLLLSLLKDNDPRIREAACIGVIGFGRDGIAEAVPKLTELLADADEECRFQAARGLERFGSAAESARPALLKCVREEPSRKVRYAATTAVLATGQAGVDTILPLIEDDNVEIRIVAAGNLSRWGERLLPKFTRLARDPEMSVRVSAARAFNNFKTVPPDALEAFASLMHDKEFPVRYEAMLTAVGRLENGKDKEFITAQILKLAKDDQRAVENAQHLWLAGPAAVPALIKVLDNDTPTFRANAVDSLGRLGPAAKEAVPALTILLTDSGKVAGSPQKEVRDHVREALDQIRGDNSQVEAPNEE